MPVLPLPEECELNAITKFRKQRIESRSQQHYMDNYSSSGTDFEFEPFGEAVAQQSSAVADVEITSEHFFENDTDEEMPSTSEDTGVCVPTTLHTPELKQSDFTTPTSFEVLARGEGFLAINSTIDGCEYSGMLFKTESSSTQRSLPAVFSPNARQKFMDLCQKDEVDVVADQWVSMLTTRQLLPSRQRRTCSANWAKRQGRMICYGCLCVVPQENSMPFACKCKERQRQRASRLKCGYLPPKNRLVVVGKVNRNSKSNGQPKLPSASKKTRTSEPPLTHPLTSSNEELVKTAHTKLSVSPIQIPTEENSLNGGLHEISSRSNDSLVQKSTSKQMTPLSIVIIGESEAKETAVQIASSNELEKLSNHSLLAEQTPKRNDAGSFSAKNTNISRAEKCMGVKRKNSSSLEPIKKHSLSNPIFINDESHPKKVDEKACSRRGLLSPSNKEERILVISNSNSEKKIAVEEKTKKVCQTPLSRSFPPLSRIVKSEEDALSSIGNNSQYVIRNNSPLQMTILKVPSPCKPKHQLSTSMDTPSTSRFIMSPTPTPAAFEIECQRDQNSGSHETGEITNDSNGIFTSSILSTKSQKVINLERRISLLKQSRSGSVNTANMTPTSNSEMAKNQTDSQHVKPKENHLTVAKEREESAVKDKSSIDSKNQLIPTHGIQIGDIVWARAKQSAYWPGEVIEVNRETVKVAWCGETTYNEVDVAMVEPFTMETLGNRFSPSHKDSASKKKLCLAIAEAIETIRPPKSELNLRLNTVIAKLLTTKYQWNLDGVVVYRGQKKMLMGHIKPTKASSSPENQQAKTEEMIPTS